MGRRSYKQRRTITRIKNQEISDITKKKQIYQLRGYDCDFIAKDFNSKKVYLIEQKITLNNYNYGVAITQLMMGEIKIHRYTDFIVEKKIVFCYNNKLFNDSPYNEGKVLINDLRKFLGIYIIVKNELPHNLDTI